MRVKDIDLQTIFKYGAMFYVVLALMAVPTGISSYQHHLTGFELPDFIPVPGAEQNPGADDPEGNKASLAAGEAQIREAGGDVAPSEARDGEAENPSPPFHAQIMQAAQTYDVDPALIRAVIQTESGYNPQAVSSRGAQGLMQLMPSTARWLGIEDSFDPAMNIDGGVRYLKLLLDRFGGKVSLALAAYNAGSRYVRKYKGVPPFPTTRTYVKKVLKYRELYKKEILARNS